MIIQSTREATREELIQRINELQSQVNMFDKAYTGAIQESKKWFDIAFDSIPKKVIRDKIQELEKTDIEKSFDKYYFDYQCNLYDFVAGMKKSLKELLGDE